MSANDHNRPSICTASGIEFFPCDPNPDDVRLDDIAHALSMVNRYCGHTREPYSVAQHSCMVAELVRDGGAPIQVVAMALLHDAAEAYIGDVAGPLKRTDQYQEYRQIEKGVGDAIDLAFGLADIPSRTVAQALRVIKAADRAALDAERRDLMPDCDWWEKSEPCVAIPTIVTWSWRYAREEFVRLAESCGLRS